MAKIRKSRGKFLALKNETRDWISDVASLKIMDTNYFKNIFQSNHIKCIMHSNLSNHTYVSKDDCDSLSRPFTAKEVKINLFQMDPIKSPGSGGIQPVFFQRFWADLSASIVNFCSFCFSSTSIPFDFNRSYITLILKSDQPETMLVFRPIGLCNTIYKLVTKIVTSRLWPILNKLFSPLQSSFIKGRGI